MVNRISDHRLTWLAVGVAAGLCISYFWPHEPALAAASDRSDKFALVTVPASPGVAGLGEVEAVFVLDFLTGRLQGGVLHTRSGKFSHLFFRSLFADFRVNPDADPSYAIVGGKAALTAGRVQMGQGVVYVAELTSGRVAAYGFPFSESRAPGTPVELQLLDFFPFREALRQ